MSQDKLKEALIGIGVGQQILENLEKEGLKIEPLKYNFKKYYEEYKASIKLDEKQVPEDMIKQFKEEIEEELLAIECFLRWLQEEKGAKLI